MIDFLSGWLVAVGLWFFVFVLPAEAGNKKGSLGDSHFCDSSRLPLW
jgi:hypothetical protein